MKILATFMKVLEIFAKICKRTMMIVRGLRKGSGVSREILRILVRICRRTVISFEIFTKISGIFTEISGRTVEIFKISVALLY